jgi:S1-C subfamily serine protease
MSVLDELSDAIAGAAAGAGRSVVRIGRHGGRGAGTVIAEGLVLTSAHNLRGSEVTVTFGDGRQVVGEVKGVDADGDLAVVAADTGSVPPVEWAPGETALTVGSPIFAVGIVPGSTQARVTFGTVSATGAAFRGPRGRLISDGFEHTAVVGRGSSGGPVLDSRGRLAGVNTHRPGDGFYLARPADEALKERADALARGEAPSRRRLGVALTPPHVARRLRSAVGLPPRDGVLIRDVAEDGPAAAAGLQRGDLIVAAGGGETGSIDALLAAIDAVGEDGILGLTVLRGTQEVSVEVRFEPEGA